VTSLSVIDLTSKKIQCIPVTRINCLKLFKKIMTVYSGSHMKCKNTFWGQNVELVNEPSCLRSLTF
jgi:hypothetical protein